MAQLKSTVISGSLRVTDSTYTSTLQTQILHVPTASNGTSYGAGTDGQILRTNGTSAYWGNAPTTGVTSITIQTSSPLSGGSATATTGTGSYTIGFANQNKNLILAGPSTGSAAAPTFRALVEDDIPTISASKASLGSVSNNADLNGVTGAKGDIIYWSAADTPAHLTNTSSTTKHFLSITNQVPSWVTLSNSDVGLGNVENTKLSTWTGSSNITTIGTLSSGIIPWSLLSSVPTLAQGNGRIFYGTCDTAAATVDKVVTCTVYDALTNGDLLIVKFTYTNSGAVANLTLNVNSKGAKAVKKLHNGAINNLTGAKELNKDTLCIFMYNGSQWVLINGDWNSTYNYMRPYESTAKGSYSSQGDNPAKTATAGWRFQLSAGKYFAYTHYYDNTAKSAITLNIGSTGAKPIYINGTASSASNYTLPGGQYIVYYDGTNYHFRTDNYMPGNISGTADNIRSTVAVAQGGTGNTSFTENCVIVGNGTNSLVSKGLKVTDNSGDITLQPNVSGKAMTINFSDTANIAYNPLNGCIEIIA